MTVPKCWYCVIAALVLASCQASPAPPTLTIAPPAPRVTTVSPTASQTPKATPSQTPTATAEAVTPTSAGADSQYPGSEHFPNLWTQIDKSKIMLYPFNYLGDYTYDKDGALWMVGSFGVVRRGLDNRQTWYSIKNGLPKNAFTTIAIDPHGDVWAGGSDNALFRFDGQQWIDEGDRLPPPYDDRNHYLCYSKNIMAIDFGPEGSVWVVNAGLEIYRQVFGQWSNVPFTKEGLPIAGGGACPEGIRVQAEDDVILKFGGYPSGYHYQFDGQQWTWSGDADYAAVDELLASRHHSDLNPLAPSLRPIPGHGLTDWPFDAINTEPLWWQFDKSTLGVDTDGTVWFMSTSLFRYSEGTFKHAGLPGQHGWEQDDLDFSKSVPLRLWGNQMVYFDKFKGYYWVDWLLWDDGVDPGPPYERYDTIDQQGRVWLYHPKPGLVMIDQGVVQRFGLLPDYWTGMPIGGVFHLADGRVWLGSTGRVFEYNRGRWRQLVVTGSDQLFTHFVQDRQGVVYGATAEGLYLFTSDQIEEVKFVEQNQKPSIIIPPGQPEDCAAHKTYRAFTNCSMYHFQWPHEGMYPDYTVRYLGLGNDGAIIYINNHLIAEWKGGKSRAFLFDVFDIAGAVVDPAGGYIWMFSKVDGIVRLDPDIFDDYQVGRGYFRSDPVDTPTIVPGK